MSGEANADEPVVVVPEGDSLVYEEELLRNPYSLKLWLRYLEVSTNYARHLYLHRNRIPCEPFIFASNTYRE